MKFILSKICQNAEEHEQLKIDCARVATELNTYMPDFVWETKPPSASTNRYTVRAIVSKSLREKAKTLHKEKILKLMQKKIGADLYQLIVDSMNR